MNNQSLIERYKSLRERLDAALIEKKMLEKEVEEVSEEIIGQMEMTSVSSYKTNSGHGVSKGVRRSAQITDYRALEDWALTIGNEEIKEIWGLLQVNYKLEGVKPEVFTMQPQRKLLNIMLKHYAAFAGATGRDLNDLLPPGLKQHATEYLILRKPTKKQESEEFLSNAESILDLAKRGAGNG